MKANTRKQAKRNQKEDKRQRTRAMTELHEKIILTASELRLMDVSDHARESVRAFLAPLLPHILIGEGECVITSRLLIQMAKSPRVEYIEGVWSHPRRPTPMRHAWNTVDGHLVDLTEEYKFALVDRWCARTGEEWLEDDAWNGPRFQRKPSNAYTFDAETGAFRSSRMKAAGASS
jgi:hypothetical protein